MSSSIKESIITEYHELLPLHEQFTRKMDTLLSDLLDVENITVHQITHRVKTVKSLSQKIDLKQNKYSSLNDITDICGIRIITYLESDVDKVARIIKKEFEIDTKNSIDKRNHESNVFGYNSLHFVVQLNQQRLQQTEYSKYSNCLLEIQVRSILQHAWAEIEHDTGYKESNVPKPIKRGFCRLSALLETADIEFDRLKQSINEYRENIKSEIISKPKMVLIDNDSLYSFIKSNLIISEAAKIIQKNTGCKFSPKKDFKSENKMLRYFGINNIEELSEVLLNNKDFYLSFVDLFTQDISDDLLSESLPIFYLQHFLAAKTENEAKVAEYFNLGNMGIDEYPSPNDLINIYHLAQKKMRS